MTERTEKVRTKRKETPWDWLFVFLLGSARDFIVWMITTILVAVFVEFIGAYWWGFDHSNHVLQEELSYVGTFQKNLLTGYYPSDVAAFFVSYADRVISWLHLRSLSESLANSSHTAFVYLGHGLQILINSLFIFSLRLSVCVTALTGFLVVALVSAIDGLVERDIRRACGGIESAIAYHRAKRAILPLIFVSFGIYMGSPVSIHPTLVFLPVMFLVGYSIYIATSRFKKYL